MGMLRSGYAVFNDAITGVELMTKDTEDKFIKAIFFTGLIAGTLLFGLGMTNHLFELMNHEKNTKLTVQYDCRVAEISVDYPQQVKEQCRKLLMPNISYGEK